MGGEFEDRRTIDQVHRKSGHSPPPRIALRKYRGANGTEGCDDMGTAQIQGELWGARARDWAELQEGAFKPLYAAAFAAAKVTKGTRLLDIGCGAGLALQVAVAEGANVTGIDAAQGLIAIAKERLPRADIRVGELEELPYGEGTFDVVTGFNSFQYAADRVHALSEAKRVVRPGGLVVAAVWGDPAKCEMAPYLAALGALMPPPPPGTPGPWALSDPGVLEDLAESAGLKPTRSERVTIVLSFADHTAALRALCAAGPAVRALRHSGEEAARGAIAGAIAPYRKADGSYALTNEFRFIVASA
jgi:SAM-dependent methyltransferase